ncbi:flippase [Treponema zioleckii]|uniref:flippase n=1 Tax=Treponema zioleckii TaxID=331680 RepID=UPI00168BA354|nr:flippase [Treponema zioleckii]
MAQKSLKVNAFLNTLKTVLTLFFPLITFPYSSRVLGPESIGKVNFAQSVVSYFAIIASLGISTYATREAAKVRDNKEKLSQISSEIFIINLISTVIAYVLLVASLIFVRKFDDYRLLIIICSTLIVFTTVGMGWLYQAVEDYLYITVRSLAFQIISVILLFTLVKSKEDYLWYASINIISNVGANILNFIHARKYIQFKTGTKLLLKRHLKPIFVLFATTIAGTIFASIDTTMLGFMSNDSEVGFYSAGMKIIHMINGIFPAMIIVIFPRVSYYFANNDRKSILLLSSKTVNCLLCFSLPVSVGLFLLMQPLVILFCGVKYIEAISISKIMCPYLVFSALGHFLGGTILVAHGKEKQQLYSMIAAGLLDVVLNVFFIRLYGAKGAALATLLSQIVLTLFYIIALWNFTKELYVKLATLQFSAAAIIMGISVYFVRNLFTNLLLQLFVPFVVGVLTYALMLVVLRNQFFLATTNDIFKKLRRE